MDAEVFHGPSILLDVSSRNIPISLFDLNFGEEKAQNVTLPGFNN